MAARDRLYGFVWLLPAAVLSLAACTSSSDGGSAGGDGEDTFTVTAGKGKITIEWSHSSAESYTLEYSNASGSEASAPNRLTISGTITDVTSPYEHDYLVYGETYSYTLLAIDASGNSTTIGTGSATPDRLPLDEIEFADTEFETCVIGSTTEGGDDGDSNLGATFADEIDELDCGSATFGDFTGIGHLTSLIEVYFLYVELSSFSGFEPLVNLQELELQYCDYEPLDVSALAALTNLRVLTLPDSKVTSGVDTLITLTNATSIDLSSNATTMRCSELQTLISALGIDVVTPSTANAPDDCTNGS